MVITVLLGGPVYTGTVESESAARRVLQARAKAEEQSLERGVGTENIPIILGCSFSEKRQTLGCYSLWHGREHYSVPQFP